MCKPSLSGILTHTGGSIAIHGDNGTEFKNTVCNEACEQMASKDYSQICFIPMATKESKTYTTFLREHLLNSLNPVI